MDLPPRRARPSVTIALCALALPSVALGIHLIGISARGMTRADGTGEGIFWAMFFWAGLALEFLALPSLFWAATAHRREAKPNLVRLIVGGVLSLGSFTPVAVVAYALLA